MEIDISRNSSMDMTMDISDAITVTKIDVLNEGDNCYLMVGWQIDSFEIYLFNQDKLWKGRFSSKRLAGFSKNLHLTEVEYFSNTKKCLSQGKASYCYELKSGFFYWKKKVRGSWVIEGFLPMELDPTPKTMQPNLVEILLALNSNLKEKINGLKYKFDTIKYDYKKSLTDTEQFLHLKIDMEKALIDRFLSLLRVKKNDVNTLKLNQGVIEDTALIGGTEPQQKGLNNQETDNSKTTLAT